MPQGDLIVKILIALNVVVLILTYPLTIYPANQTLEDWTINRIFKNRDEKSRIKYWSKNLSRVLICISAAYFGIELSKVLDKFIGLIGAIFCAPLAMTLPTFCHLKMIAKTRQEQMYDIIIIFISLLAMALCII